MLKTLQPFYTDGRRFLQLSIDRIDDLLSKGARASIDNGTVTFVVPGADDVYAKTRAFGQHRATNWVNQFNSRAS